MSDVITVKAEFIDRKGFTKTIENFQYPPPHRWLVAVMPKLSAIMYTTASAIVHAEERVEFRLVRVRYSNEYYMHVTYEEV